MLTYPSYVAQVYRIVSYFIHQCCGVLYYITVYYFYELCAPALRSVFRVVFVEY